MNDVNERQRRFLIGATSFLIIPRHQYLDNHVLEIGTDASTN
ncbi:hypothetical protein [Ketobacter alkanivorans]|jgi:hypothetical protein|nr:hypothetical protein [Ketobacter alkanivorans]